MQKDHTMRKSLIIIFCILSVINGFFFFKYLDSKQTKFIEYVKGDCFLRYNKGIVDYEFDSISKSKGFIRITFINQYGLGCKSIDLIDSCKYLRYSISIDNKSYKINNTILPIDSSCSFRYDSLTYLNPWWIYDCSIKFKNCGKIIGYRTFKGDTVDLKYDNLLLLGDLKIDQKPNKAFKVFYIGLIILNLIILILMIILRKAKNK